MSFVATFYKGRTTDVDLFLTEADGETSLRLAASDVVRFKVFSRAADTPILDLDSALASANGSVVTINEFGGDPTAQVTVRAAEGDTSGLNAGTYSAELSAAIDAETAPADALRWVEPGICHVLESPGGDVGLT